MQRLTTIQSIKQQIDDYEKHFTGAPLLIGIDNNSDYTALLSNLINDFGKQIVRMSDVCEVEIPPDPTFQISTIINKSKEKPIIWIGAAQAKMLYGYQETEKFFINLLGSSFRGPVAVLCPFCCSILESVGSQYEKQGYYIIVVASKNKNIPSIHVSSYENAFLSKIDSVRGMKELLRILEDGKYSHDILLHTTCRYSVLAKSMYPVSEVSSPYEILCQHEPSIATNTDETNGTNAQWQRLVNEIQSRGSLSKVCGNSMSAFQLLLDNFGNVSSDNDKAFPYFIYLKVLYGKGDNYFSYCLQKSKTIDELENKIYMCILDISKEDKRFSTWIHQRRYILSILNMNRGIMKNFCELATMKGRDILWYITDKTDVERAALIHAICSYTYTPEELAEIFNFSAPQLAAYLQPFTFDELNTRVMETDAPVRPLLTDYFQRYKFQKLTNHQDQDFVDLVESEAVTRSFTKLQSRSSIVKKLDKKDSQVYFFDALGVEFLSFIEARAEEYGMQFECFIGHCNLPSITSKNKEFYDAFPPDSILKESGLDDIKHEGTQYDFRLTREPLHIFDELALLDKDLKMMSSVLESEQCKRIIILSDHGASRLAVTYQNENGKLELTEPGQHSGRCCPAAQDPGIDFVTYEDGFAVLANYQRFKGSRKADVETHGGATLEETVVPVIILTLKPKKQTIFFVDPIVLCSPKDGSSIQLFANPPLKEPHMVVNGHIYDGLVKGDEHNVLFEMPDIRRSDRHEAVIYDGGIKKTVLSFETKRQTKSNQLI